MNWHSLGLVILGAIGGLATAGIVSVVKVDPDSYVAAGLGPYDADPAAEVDLEIYSRAYRMVEVSKDPILLRDMEKAMEDKVLTNEEFNNLSITWLARNAEIDAAEARERLWQELVKRGREKSN